MTDARMKFSLDAKFSPEDVSFTLSMAVAYLLDNRDFMGLQLDYAHGNITKSEFDSRADKYLQTPELKIDIDVFRDIAILWQEVHIAGLLEDTETLALLVGCPIDQVERLAAKIDETIEE